MFEYRKYLFSCGFFACVILTACAPSQGPIKQRFFWPLPLAGVEPKIEYIGFLQSDKDLQLRGAGWVERSVLGEYPPVPLFVVPYYIAALSEERLVVSDTAMRKVKILDMEKGVMRELIGENGTPHKFSLPLGVAGSDTGAVYVVDSIKGEILKFGADDKLIDTFAGKSVLGHPVGISVDDRGQRFCVSDAVEHNIAVFDFSGNLLFKIGERGSQPGQFNFPTDVEFDEKGNLFVLDALNYRVQVFDASTNFIREFGEVGTAAGSFRLPKGLAVSPYGQVFVTDVLSHKVVVFDHQGEYLLTFGDKSYALDSGEVSPGGLFAPRGVAVDAAGQILVVDGVNRMIQRFQYLTDGYLKEHPILKEQVFMPPGIGRQLLTPFPSVDGFEGAL